VHWIQHSLSSLGGALWFAFVIWMLIDCFRVQESFYWYYIIFFFQPFGAILYFITHKLSDFELTSRIGALWSGRRRIAELKAQIHALDRPYHWAKLGDEYIVRRNWTEAGRCYDEALGREPDMEEAHYGRGRACLALGKFDEALKELIPIVTANPKYAYGEGLMEIARAWRGLGQPEAALAAYDELLKSYTYSAARFEYAQLLHEMNRTEEALTMMRQIVDDGRHATGFSKAQERRWGRKAGRFLRLRGLRA